MLLSDCICTPPALCLPMVWCSAGGRCARAGLSDIKRKGPGGAMLINSFTQPFCGYMQLMSSSSEKAKLWLNLWCALFVFLVSWPSVCGGHVERTGAWETASRPDNFTWQPGTTGVIFSCHHVYWEPFTWWHLQNVPVLYVLPMVPRHYTRAILHRVLPHHPLRQDPLA